MTDTPKGTDRDAQLPMLRSIGDLDLTAEQRDALGERVAALTAINVYRQLQTARRLAIESGVAGCNIITNCSNGSCNIITNCSSSSSIQ
jgi:hypothetical protein